MKHVVATVPARIGFLLAALCTGCASSGTAPSSAPTAAVVVARDYESACASCHDRGGFAVRVLADRLGAGAALIHQGTTLPPEAIRAVVRRGLGAMPAMSRAEVSDAELEGIVRFLARTDARRATP